MKGCVHFIIHHKIERNRINSSFFFCFLVYKNSVARICKNCNKLNSNHRFALCPKCRKNKNWEYWEQRLLMGMCLHSGKCPNKSIKGQRFCQDCSTKEYNIVKENNKKLSGCGLCVRCKTNKYMEIYENKPEATIKMCRTCYLQQTSLRYLGSKNNWKELLELLEKQGFRCAYSGETIILGVNDSVDHIIAQKTCPEKKYDITNMQWITRDVNRMKSDLDEQRFFDLLTKILENCKNRRHFISSSC